MKRNMINVSSSPRVLILSLLLLFLEWKFYLHAFKTHIQLSSVDLTSHKTIYVTFAKVSLFRAHTKLNRFQSITQPNCIEYSTHLHEFHTLIQMNDASFDAHNLLCWFSLQFFFWVRCLWLGPKFSITSFAKHSQSIIVHEQMVWIHLPGYGSAQHA